MCLDSDVLIWGLMKEASRGQENMISKVSSFINHLHTINKKIILPTPIITELTWVLDKEKRIDIVQKINRNFIVASFDKKAALICSDLLSQYQNQPDYNIIKEELGKRRLKFDTMIIAIAISNNCEHFYTNNIDDFKLAKENIKISNIPSLPEQTNLKFENDKK